MALVLFTDQDRTLVANTMKTLKENEAIKTFKQLSDVIKESTDLLPPKAAPSLARLATAYSVIDIAIANGLTQADDILTEFVVKSCEVLQRGMSDTDQALLNEIGNQLNYDFTRQLPVFNDECREELIDIYKDILEQTGGERLQNLIKMRKPLEVRVVESSRGLENLAKQLARAQGKVDALNYDIEMSERAIQINSVMEAVVGEGRAASVRDFFREGFKIFDRIKKSLQVDTPAPIKEVVTEELIKLKRQILAQQRAVQERRNTQWDDQESFWLFSWKVREAHLDDEERLACEKLWSLLEQTAILSDRLSNLDSWSTDEFKKLMTSAKEELRTAETRWKKPERCSKMLGRSTKSSSENSTLW
jgi:hypothetical protein